jgi:hypothetical protein
VTTVELVRFRVDRDRVQDLLAARPAMLADFEADRAGFIRAQLVRLPDDEWLDIVEWRSLDDFTESRALRRRARSPISEDEVPEPRFLPPLAPHARVVAGLAGTVAAGRGAPAAARVVPGEHQHAARRAALAELLAAGARQQEDGIGGDRRQRDVGRVGIVVAGLGVEPAVGAGDDERGERSAGGGGIQGLERRGGRGVSLEGGVQRVAHRVAEVEELAVSRRVGAAGTDREALGDPREPGAQAVRGLEPVVDRPPQRVHGVVQLDGERLVAERAGIRGRGHSLTVAGCAER